MRAGRRRHLAGPAGLAGDSRGRRRVGAGLRCNSGRPGRRGSPDQLECHDLDESLPIGQFDLVTTCYLHSPVEFGRTRVLRAAAAAVRPGGIRAHRRITTRQSSASLPGPSQPVTRAATPTSTRNQRGSESHGDARHANRALRRLPSPVRRLPSTSTGPLCEDEVRRSLVPSLTMLLGSATGEVAGDPESCPSRGGPCRRLIAR